LHSPVYLGRRALADLVSQLDVSDDGYLSLMSDDGDTKDDVRMPDGEIGEKINKLFKVEEKDTSKSIHTYAACVE
jgi:hypothetical protein